MFVQATQNTARVLLWEGRELISGLWVAHTQQELMLRNARLACSMLDQQRATVAAQAKRAMKEACSPLNLCVYRYRGSIAFPDSQDRCCSWQVLKARSGILR